METIAIENIINHYDLAKPELLNYFDKSRNLDDEFRNPLTDIANSDLLDFIRLHVKLDSNSTINFTSSTYNNFSSLKSINHNTIINLEKINDIRFINKYLELVNLKLADNGLFVGCVETYPDRKKNIKKKYPEGVYKVMCAIDVIVHRIIPKLWVSKKTYFFLTKGKGRTLSRAEMFGRLYSCGFEIIDEANINDLQYFVAKKTGNPKFDNNPTYGPLISLRRVGKNKNLFKVYKLRTMHPYSEYLQSYVYEKNKLQDGGKIKDDFRISPEGRFFRKFWLDEIPMIFNILKGEMKLIGVRPLSQHFFGLYPKHIQELRTQFKPGFIPPFYADLPSTFDEVVESERLYLESYKKAPFRTDIKYLYLSLKNVIFKGARSN